MNATVFENAAQLKDQPHGPETLFRCHECSKVKQTGGKGIGTGYGVNKDGSLICYDCCAAQDVSYMLENGKITLYLTCEPAHYQKRPEGRKTKGKLTNFPGTLAFYCHTRTGHHNIARTRYDCWFIGPDGHEWHGIMYGENTQLCHCRRTKTKKCSPEESGFINNLRINPDDEAMRMVYIDWLKDQRRYDDAKKQERILAS